MRPVVAVHPKDSLVVSDRFEPKFRSAMGQQVILLEAVGAISLHGAIRWVHA